MVLVVAEWVLHLSCYGIYRLQRADMPNPQTISTVTQQHYEIIILSLCHIISDVGTWLNKFCLGSSGITCLCTLLPYIILGVGFVDIAMTAA